MTEEQEKIVLENMGLIGISLKKYGLSKYYEEFVDVAYIGLVKGAKIYNPEKGYKASAIITRCITNELFLELRKRRQSNQKANFNTISLESKFYDNIPFYEVVSDERINIEQEMIRQEEINLLLQEIEKLKLKEKIALCHYYGINGYKILNQKEIGLKLNVHQAQVSRIIQKAINKIKKSLKED